MEYISTGERVGYRRGRLDGKSEMVMFFASHLLKLDDENLKQTIQSRLALIDKESELDNLIDLLLMQPTLNSFMNYLPELDVEISPS